MKRCLFIGLCLHFAFTGFAQNFQSGLDFEGEAKIYNALPREPILEGSKDEGNLPLRVDLSPFCPQVGNQGQVFSCVGWSVGYAALSIERAIANAWRDQQLITANAHSALFIYNQIKTGGDCMQGSKIADALQLLVEKGNCFARDFDADPSNCQRQPDAKQLAQAQQFKIEDFVTLFGSEEKNDIKILQLKKGLARNKPVVIGLKVLKNFYMLQGASFWWPTQGNTTPAGGHALVLVGYDDQKQAFRLFNSWGTAWGDRGYIWVKYEDLANNCKYAYQLQLTQENIASRLAVGSLVMDKSSSQPLANNNHSQKNTSPSTRPLPKDIGETSTTSTSNTSTTNRQTPPAPAALVRRLGGNFVFKYLDGFTEQEKPIFKAAEVTFYKNRYRANQAWQVGQRFQLLATTQVSNEYVYVFSLDAQGKMQIHWPRQAALNDKFAGINETAFVPDNESRLIIPGENKVLKITQAGTDRLCVLFSSRKIQDIKEVVQKLSQMKGDVLYNISQVLGKRLVPWQDIRYVNQQIGFFVETKSDGYIVPLVLEVNSQ